MTKKIIGITGGIGSGKSVVSKLIRIMNYPVYDADSESKRICNSFKPLINNLIKIFGPDIYNEYGLNKKYFADIIFNSKEKIQKANEIIHPVVAEDFIKWTKCQESNLVFIESAILNQSIFKDLIDENILVLAPEKLRIERAAKRDNVNIELIENRVKNQINYEHLLLNDSNIHLVINDNEHLLIPQIEAVI